MFDIQLLFHLLLMRNGPKDVILIYHKTVASHTQVALLQIKTRHPNLSLWENCSPWDFDNSIQNTIILADPVENSLLSKENLPLFIHPFIYLLEYSYQSFSSLGLFSQNKNKAFSRWLFKIFTLHSSSSLRAYNALQTEYQIGLTLQQRIQNSTKHAWQSVFSKVMNSEKKSSIS